LGELNHLAAAAVPFVRSGGCVLLLVIQPQ
jgi:hypothetical protein